MIAAALRHCVPVLVGSTTGGGCSIDGVVSACGKTAVDSGGCRAPLGSRRCPSRCGLRLDSRRRKRHPGTLEALTEGQTAPSHSRLVTRDFSPGPVRYSFLVDREGRRLVSKDRASVWLARGLKEKPFQRATATLEPSACPASPRRHTASRRSTSCTSNVPAAGTYWVLAKPDGSTIARAREHRRSRSAPYSPAIGVARAAPRRRRPSARRMATSRR